MGADRKRDERRSERLRRVAELLRLKFTRVHLEASRLRRQIQKIGGMPDDPPTTPEQETK